MKAYVRGSAQNQEVKLTEVGISKVQKNEVLIKVHAFGVGIHDRYFIPMDANFPYVIGLLPCNHRAAVGQNMLLQDLPH